jgi:hypothetical protein
MCDMNKETAIKIIKRQSKHGSGLAKFVGIFYDHLDSVILDDEYDIEELTAILTLLRLNYDDSGE